MILDGQGNLYGTTERGGPNGFGTVFELFQPATGNVTSDLAVKLGGFVYNRATRQFSQSITITNTGAEPIAGPIELLLLNLKNATLANQTGVTQTQGDPYITVLSGGLLGVGQSLTITLFFIDPTLAPITETPEFLAGPIPPAD